MIGRGPTAGFRLAVGVALIMVAAVLLSAAQLLSERQHRAYDPGSTPPAAYHLTQGRTYQLSTPGGVKKLTRDKVLGTGVDLMCTRSPDGSLQVPLAIASTRDDARDLYVFATFVAPASGNFKISCKDVAQVFIDDADNVARDWGSLVVLLASILGLVGVASALSGGYQRSLTRSSGRHSVYGALTGSDTAEPVGGAAADERGDPMTNGLRFDP